MCTIVAAGACTLPHRPGNTQPARDGNAWARGVVYHDLNGNGARDPGERELSGVRVSNGTDVVPTDGHGRYRLAVNDDTILFVIKPSGWMTPTTAANLPRFHYIHKPGGSPPSKYAGVPPTGPLPASIDFPLVRHREPDRFQVVFLGDPQPLDGQDIAYLAHDTIEELIGTDAAFGVNLGDNVYDDLSLYARLNETVGLIGVPWYSVLGNHDLNHDAPDDRRSDETFERVFGPPYYAFDYGSVHFLVLDDVAWFGPTSGSAGRYEGALDSRQLEFIRNDLAGVPRGRLVVLMMHIPLLELTNRDALFRLLEDRPHTFSIAGHWHIQRHHFFGLEEGWNGDEPHHHLVNATACGSWWTGALDETGVPHSMMRCGTPTGYSIITFDGHRYTIDFKAARRPADYQMNIFAPEEIASTDSDRTEVLVNVFAGSERSTVEMRVGEQGRWTALERVARFDPHYARLKESEAGAPEATAATESRVRPLPDPLESPHLWRGLLPANLAPGAHLIHVRTTDMFGRTFTARRVIQVH